MSAVDLCHVCTSERQCRQGLMRQKDLHIAFSCIADLSTTGCTAHSSIRYMSSGEGDSGFAEDSEGTMPASSALIKKLDASLKELTAALEADKKVGHSCTLMDSALHSFRKPQEMEPHRPMCLVTLRTCTTWAAGD